jgi:hypothetical protein
VIDLLTDMLAAHRLTRMVTADVLTEPMRERLIEATYVAAGRAEEEAASFPNRTWQERVEYDEDPPKLATLLTCRWCASMWLAFGIVAARQLAPRAWPVVARALALSSAAALLATLEE